MNQSAAQSATPSQQNSLYTDDRKFIEKAYENLKTNLIQITEDKLRIILMNQQSNNLDSRAWINPLSLLITLIIVLLTSNFKEPFWISAETWRAICIVATALIFGWLIKSGISLYNSFGKTSIEEIINQIKAEKPQG